MKKTSDRRQKPSISAEEWDFRFGPIKVKSGNLASFAVHWKDTEEVLEKYLLRAMQQKFLPETVILAQFVSVPPKHAPPDLRAPAVVRTSESRFEDYLRAYLFIANYVKSKTWSFHNRANEFLHSPASTLLVFTVGQHPPKEHPFDGVNVIWVNFETKDLPSCEWLAGIQSLELIAAGEPTISGFSKSPILEMLKHPKNKDALTFNPGSSPKPKVRVYCKVEMSPDEQLAVSAFADTLLTERYLAHVLPCVLCGPVVLVVAKKVFFDTQEQNKLVDNSGLTAMFRTGTRIGYSELEDCYRAGHRLSTIFTNLHSIAQFVGEREREQGRSVGAANAFRMITHSLGNAIIYARRGADEVERVLKLESYTVAAAGALYSREPVTDMHAEPPWEIAGCEIGGKIESLDESIRAGTFLSAENFTIKAGCMRGKRAEPRFVALLVELARNMEQHSLKKLGSISLTTGANEGLITLKLTSDSDYCYPRDLPDKFRFWRQTLDASRGLDFVWLLLRSLATDATSLSFRFGSSKAQGAQKEPIIIQDIPIHFWVASSDAGRLAKAEKAGNTMESFNYIMEIHNLKALQ